MYEYNPGIINFKIFVKERNTEETSEKCNTHKKYFPVSPLTGEKAKEFYEDVLKESEEFPEEEKSIKQKPQVKRSTRVMQNKKFKSSDLLWMAQNNDVNKLSSILGQVGCDINVADDFGWTPLMCASCSGAKEAVVLLLESGADPHKCDRLGNTALKLAQQKNNKEIIEILENFRNDSDDAEAECSVQTCSVETFESFYCPKCNENFNMKKSKHESSTLHLFNSQLKTQTFYGIPECNKGFQILLRKGWDKEKGLGRDGTGRKFPVKAVMKKDRLGIGAPQLPVKTKQDSQHTKKYENKKILISNKWNERNFEKNFRLEFS